MNKILVIPRHSVFVKFLDVPSVEESEIGKMAEFQAMKEIPYPKEDIIVSYKNLGCFKQGFSSLMLAVANRDMIQEKIRERISSNVETEDIRLYTELLYLYLSKKGVINHDKISLIVHIGKDDSEVMIINRYRIIFFFFFENSEKFLHEIDCSLIAYRRDKMNEGIDDIIIAYPSNVDIQEVSPQIKEHLGSHVRFYEYRQDLRDLDLPAEISLLPREVSHKKIRSQKKQEFLVTYFLFGFILILSFGFLVLRLYEKNKFVKLLSADIKQAQAQTQGLDIYLRKTEIMKEHLNRGALISEVLKRSYGLISDDISISGIECDRKNNFFYKGTANNMDSMFFFVKKLEESGYFSKVEVKYATKKKVKSGELTGFNIQCQLNL